MSKILAIIVGLVLAESGISHAEEFYRQFSLDYGSLTPAPADPKAPKPGGVTAKYGFSLARDFKTYVGTGLAYSIKPEARPWDTKKIRAGVAGQAGFRYLLGEDSSLSFDYKYFNITPDAAHGESKTPPQSIGIGLEIRF